MRLVRMATLAGMAILTIIAAAACAAPGEKMPTASIPAGKAFADGKEIFFVHTEASDPDVAKLLSDMMESPVLFVPALASVPSTALAQVYVFDNGLAGKGPLGFQADVFDNPPGSAGYSPLRSLNVVTWADPAKARQLTSVVEIETARTGGEVTIAQPGIVINMPFAVWEGGKR